MTGTNHTSSYVAATGINSIDGLLFGTKWTGTVTYAFPTLASQYGAYPTSLTEPYELTTFGAVSASIQLAAKFGLEGTNASSAGFSIEGFTNLTIQLGSTSASNLRFGLTALPTEGVDGYAAYPSSGVRAGDIWLKSSSHQTATSGNKAWLDVLHEAGHAMGLKHPQDTYITNGSTFPVEASARDSIEFTVMSYKGYAGGQNGYVNVATYAQTYMMDDIRAFQQLYGADFTTNSGNTTYKWLPTSGVTYVNGVAAISPSANKIFATIWDGGGIDTYDLSAYTGNTLIDLRAGGNSSFSTAQTAVLGKNLLLQNIYAHGNIYNALQYNNDARSLIEDALGGSGNDVMIGNQAANYMFGAAGNDDIQGVSGNDTLAGGTGNDVIRGGTGANVIYGNAGYDRLYANSDVTLTDNAVDTFVFSTASDSTATSSRDIIYGFTSGQDKIQLSGMDANTAVAGDQAFTHASHTNGLWITADANGWILNGDVNGNGLADFQIQLWGVTAMSWADIIH